MAQLRRDYEKFTALDSEVVVIGPEDAGNFRRYWEKENLPYIGLPDPDLSVLKRYGQEVNIFKFGRMPAQLIVDKKGVARFVHYGNSMQDIPSNQEVLALLSDINSN